MFIKLSDARPLLAPLDAASKEYSAAIAALRAFDETGEDGPELTALINRMHETGEKFRGIMRQLEDLRVA